jgi:asparagine synthase (glutamine-hydrolysing)
MISRLRHRGPDEADVWTRGEAGLAHARLSIIDVAGGHQPMCAEDGSQVISFNGEIYNYLELREELIAKGHCFKTRSDTEVLLHLYAEDGPDCVQRLNGQWAFAVWDGAQRRLFLSRDRLGVRPLFYCEHQGSLRFASEVKALFADPTVPRQLDLQALADVFTFWFPLAPKTMFQKIRELPPGHSLTWDDGKLRIWPHWSLEYAPDEPGKRDERDYAQELWELLVDAVRLRLRADVPVGTYLSGGLDSSLITAIVRKCSNAHLRSFSVTFDEAEFDESHYQDEVVRALGTDHQKAHCTATDIARSFPDVIWHTEKPVLRTAPTPLFLLSRLVRDSGFKVVLTGEGADEILGGYDIFKEAKIRAFWASQPESRWRSLLLRRLYPYLPKVQQQSEAFLRAFFRVKPEHLSSPFFSHLPRWEMTSKLKLFFSDAVAAELDAYQPIEEMARSLPAHYNEWNRFCQAQYLETMHLFPGYILSSQGDRVAMGNSVEVRLPFLDPRVVAFAARIPPRLKMKVLTEKYILKCCAAGVVPESVRTRHKQPYRAPQGNCFVQAGAPEYVGELLSPERLRQDGIFCPDAVGKLRQKFQAGRGISVQDNMALVGIVSSQLLIDQYLRPFSRLDVHLRKQPEPGGLDGNYCRGVAAVRS